MAFGDIFNSLTGTPTAEQRIADFSKQQQGQNRLAIGLNPDGTPMIPGQSPAPQASGMLPASQEPNATKTPESWGSLLMDLQRSNEANQLIGQGTGAIFAGFAQPRDRESVSKIFNTTPADPVATINAQMGASGFQQGQDRMNALGGMLNDQSPEGRARVQAMATSLNFGSVDQLKAAYLADPQRIGAMIADYNQQTPGVKNIEQITNLQGKLKAGGASDAEIAMLTPALIAEVGGPVASKAILDAHTYAASHKGQTAPWVSGNSVDTQKYNQYVADQKTISDNQADAGSTFQGTTDTLNTLRQKLGNLKSDPDLARVLALSQDSLEKNAFQEALRNQNADWKDKIPQVLFLDSGAMRVLSDLKEATGQEYTGALQSILGHGLRPTAQEIAQVRAGYGQTPNILNFSNIKDYITQAIDPMLTRMDQAMGKAYGDSGQIDKAPDYVKPFINPIYLHGGKYHIDDGTDVADWEKGVNKKMSAQDVQDAQAAIKANPANAWHVVDGIRRKGYDVSPLAALPGVEQ